MLFKILQYSLLWLTPCLAQNMLRPYNVITEFIMETYQNHSVTPQLMPWPPPFICNVTYENNLKIDLGTHVKVSQILKKPTLTWNATTGILYTLYVTDLYYVPFVNQVHDDELIIPGTYSGFSRTENPQWIVGNIPGNKMEEGETLWEYQKPEMPLNEKQKRLYVFFVFEQSAKMNFHRLKEGQHYQNVYDFAEWYFLNWPEFGNFLYVDHEYED